MGSPDNRQFIFAQEYVKDWNGMQAAIRAGYSENSAGETACELLKIPRIAAIIEEHKENAAAVAGLSAQWVLKRWMEIAEADPNDLTQLRRICCRYCHGLGHFYHWTEAEYFQQVTLAAESKRPAPDAPGGFGYDMNADPHAGCPECGGNGIEYTFVADTRKVKGSGRKLFAGVQRTKDGIKVIMRDQDAALKNISDFFGMSKNKIELTGKAGGPLALAHIKAETMSDDDLARIVATSGNQDNAG